VIPDEGLDEIDPVRVHRHLVSYGPWLVDYLLPDRGGQDISHNNVSTPCADFLIPIFDEWLMLDSCKPRVTLFWDIMRLILGGSGQSEVLGNRPQKFLFVETDGTFTALDVLRGIAPGCGSIDGNIFSTDLDELPLVARGVDGSLLRGELSPPTECNSCAELATCGGGYPPHRYRPGSELVHRSYWCADLLKLFGHIRRELCVSPEETALRRTAYLSRGRELRNESGNN
jgi:uncharacterized protein